MVFEEYIGKKIIIFYNDGMSVSKKPGILKSVDSNFIIITNGENDLAIPTQSIIRIEMTNNE